MLERVLNNPLKSPKIFCFHKVHCSENSIKNCVKCARIGFFYGISTIQTLYKKIRISKNPYSRVVYTVKIDNFSLRSNCKFIITLSAVPLVFFAMLVELAVDSCGVTFAGSDEITTEEFIFVSIDIVVGDGDDADDDSCPTGVDVIFSVVVLPDCNIVIVTAPVVVVRFVAVAVAGVVVVVATEGELTFSVAWVVEGMVVVVGVVVFEGMVVVLVLVLVEGMVVVTVVVVVEGVVVVFVALGLEGMVIVLTVLVVEGVVVVLIAVVEGVLVDIVVEIVVVVVVAGVVVVVITGTKT